MLTAVNDKRAELGAVQNRFTSVISNLSTNVENLSASRGRITDADYATETANLTKAQILQQAGTAMLAQANSLPNTVLSLLEQVAQGPQEAGASPSGFASLLHWQRCKLSPEAWTGMFLAADMASPWIEE
jgi:hypothetical protein